MTNEKDTTKKAACCKPGTGGMPCCAYGLALLGAAVYYIQQADTFWAGVVGVGKALLWPAFLIHKLLQFLQM